LQPVYRLSIWAKISATACAGHDREMHDVVERYRALDPSASIASIDRVFPPFKLESQRNYFLAALRQAGLPE
jgi:hypothetical protein